MRPAAQPSPIKARPTVRPIVSWARANTTVPATATTNRLDMVRCGPKRSSSTPTGSCATAKARKNAPVIMPIASGEITRDRMSSGAMTSIWFTLTEETWCDTFEAAWLMPV